MNLTFEPLPLLADTAEKIGKALALEGEYVLQPLDRIVPGGQGADDHPQRNEVQRALLPAVDDRGYRVHRRICMDKI